MSNKISERFVTAITPYIANVSNNNDGCIHQQKYAIALSGGGDSMALLNLLLKHFLPENLLALHFNHNLRDESSDEAKWVGEQCAKLDVACETGIWSHNDKNESPTGNLQQAARQARYNFFAKMGEKHNLTAVFIAHNADDVAETFLMRLGRGSGLKGLAAMRESGEVLGVSVIRPLLDFGRQELREFLQSQGQTWLDDPSNKKEQFLRVRIRQNKLKFADLGLDFATVTATANSLRRAENCLQKIADAKFAEYILTTQLQNSVYTQCLTGGDGQKGQELTISADFLAEPDEIALRILEKALLTVTGEAMAPRISKRLTTLKKLRNFVNNNGGDNNGDGGNSNASNAKLTATLGGCKITTQLNQITFTTEKS